MPRPTPAPCPKCGEPDGLLVLGFELRARCRKCRLDSSVVHVKAPRPEPQQPDLFGGPHGS